MSLSQPTLRGFCPRGIKQGSHRLGDYLATLANSKFVKFEKYSPKFSSLAKLSLCSPNVLPKFWKCSKFDPRLFGDPDIWSEIPKAVAVSLKYSPSCGKLFAGFAKLTSTARHIRNFSPNSSQTVTNSPIYRHACQLVAKWLPNDLKTIIFSSSKEFGNYSPIPSICDHLSPAFPWLKTWCDCKMRTAHD